VDFFVFKVMKAAKYVWSIKSVNGTGS